MDELTGFILNAEIVLHDCVMHAISRVTSTEPSDLQNFSNCGPRRSFLFALELRPENPKPTSSHIRLTLECLQLRL